VADFAAAGERIGRVSADEIGGSCSGGIGLLAMGLRSSISCGIRLGCEGGAGEHLGEPALEEAGAMHPLWAARRRRRDRPHFIEVGGQSTRALA